MADVLSRKQRSFCMSRIRDRDTKPELLVGRLLRRLGLRFRQHVRDVPGRPDFVFTKRRRAIFVHGCFWHRHQCRFGRVKPRTNARFWAEKIRGNADRDRRVLRKLRRMGWRVLVVWECQTRNRENLQNRVIRFLEDRVS